jgi:hypothetical protein
MVRRSGAPKGSGKDGLRSKALRRLKGWGAKAYEAFLGLPVPVVLVVLWLTGAVLLGAGILALYLYGSALVRMLLGP